jgi:transcriptional regulator with XRE-family HTH domain
MKKDLHDRDMLMIGARLRLIREVYQMNQKDFAAEIGLPSNQYNQYEQGKRRPFISIAQQICDRYHVSLDWIYDGKMNHLSVDIANRLLQVAKKMDGNVTAKKEAGTALQVAIDRITKGDFYV